MKERIGWIQKYHLPYETFWIDAGWMGSNAPCPHFLEDSLISSDWPERVGSWEINRYAHPNGLKDIADAAHSANLRLLVWFEPERIHEKSDSPLLTEHPDWLLSLPGCSSKLLNLGIPEAREYLIRKIIEIMERDHIDDYRQDFNIDPMPFGRAADAPDRIGISEIKHIDGLYCFGSALRKHFPDMVIDNCASGGGRLDYRLARPGFPLCQSDFATFMEYNVDCVQMENCFLDEWLPLHGSLNWGEHDPYHAFSAGWVGYGSKIWQFNGRELTENHDTESHRKVLDWIRELRDNHLSGDVYFPTEHPENPISWCAEQVHIPSEDRGIVLIFRRQDSPSAEEATPLAALNDDIEYDLEFFDGKKVRCSGKELTNLRSELPNPRAFLLFRYRAVR